MGLLISTSTEVNSILLCNQNVNIVTKSRVRSKAKQKAGLEVTLLTKTYLIKKVAHTLISHLKSL